MTTMAIEAGDAATWGGTAMALVSLLMTLHQMRVQRRSLTDQNELQAEASQLQRRQIEAAERRALAMEELLARMTGQTLPPSPDPVGTAPLPPAWTVPPASPPADPRPSRGGAPSQPPTGPPAPSPRRPDNGQAPPYGQPAPVPPPWPQQGGYGNQGHTPAPAFEAERKSKPRRRPRRRFPTPRNRPAPAPQQPYAPRATPPLYDSGDSTPPMYDSGAATPPLPYSPWRLARTHRYTYALRNTGPETLKGVRVSVPNAEAVVRNLPEDAVVRPGETVEFLMAGAPGRPFTPEVRVSWQGHPEGVPLLPQDQGL
ncbi:hypothetical protein ACH429_03660 [Streptomyces pathocidini]|uniref:Uncharacterized protein n=2 Tax=Streptomyces pathocidini TaxID=1650571 RepID=A0ABW7UP42_9ACTN